MGVEGRAGEQRGLGARSGTSLQIGGVEQRNHLERPEREGLGCRGEESRSLVEMVLGRSRGRQGPRARNQRGWPEIDEPAAGAVIALASSS